MTFFFFNTQHSTSFTSHNNHFVFVVMVRTVKKLSSILYSIVICSHHAMH